MKTPNLNLWANKEKLDWKPEQGKQEISLRELWGFSESLLRAPGCYGFFCLFILFFSFSLNLSG